MLTKFTGDGLFFTSDTHFNHQNILKFVHRPWETIEDHDKGLIDNWNSVVGNDDTVFHLGDFCFGNPQKVMEIREQLNGNIILIRGNHDDKNLQRSLYSLFEDVLYQARIQVDGRSVYLNHFPFLCFAHGNPELYKEHYAINLFGHVHSGPLNKGDDTGRLQYLYPTQYDVGIDNNNFKPISWKEVSEIIDKQLNDWKENKTNLL